MELWGLRICTAKNVSLWKEGLSTIPTPTVSTDGTWSADAATAFTRSVFLIRTPSRGSRVECKEIVTGVRGRMLIAVRPRIRRVPRRRAATPAVATGCERGHSVSANCKEIHKRMKCTEERNREFYTETLSRSWAIILNFENGEKTFFVSNWHTVVTGAVFMAAQTLSVLFGMCLFGMCYGFTALSLRTSATLPFPSCGRSSVGSGNRTRRKPATIAMRDAPEVSKLVHEPWVLSPEHPAAQLPKIAGCSVPFALRIVIIGFDMFY